MEAYILYLPDSVSTVRHILSYLIKPNISVLLFKVLYKKHY